MSTSRRNFLIAAPGALLAACTRHATNPARAVARQRTQARATTSRPPSVPTATSAPPPIGFIRNGPRTRSAVALTFHGSGDVALLDELLTVTSQRHTPITIFAVGRWLDDNPDVAERITAARNELANHTYTHPNMGGLAAAALQDEVARCRDALVRGTGQPGRWFRPSGVEIASPTIVDAAHAAGYRTVVGYDVDPRDYEDPGAALVRSRIAASVQPGSIVSLHTGHRGTVDALPAVLDDLAARGLRTVTVSGLFA